MVVNEKTCIQRIITNLWPLTFIYTLALAAHASSSEKINIDFAYEILNFGSSNLIILKKKSKNTIKHHNIFTISLFLGSE